MKLQDNSTALTHWEDDNGAEWDIKILFSYQPAERPDYEDGHMVYPGCEAGVVDIQVERREYTLESMGTQTEWVLFDEATEAEEAEWSAEIMTVINQQGDDRGNEP